MARKKMIFKSDRVVWVNANDEGRDVSGVVEQTISWNTAPLKKGYIRITTDEAIDDHFLWDVPEDFLMAEEEYVPKLRSTLRCTFRPQEWVGNEVVDVETRGSAVWEMEHVGTVPRPGSYEVWEMRHSEGAPSWIKDWRGPFTVDFEVLKSERVSSAEEI